MLKTRCLIPLSMVAALWASACGNRDETPAEQCEQVRERLIQVELPLTDNKREAHARVMRRAMGDGFVEHCARSTTVAQRRCALDATESKGALACIANADQQPVATKETK